MKLPWALALGFGSLTLLILLIWSRRQDPLTTCRWRRWLLGVPAVYTVAGTIVILFGLLGQLTRDQNFFLRGCFYIPLPVIGLAAVFLDLVLRGRAYPRMRFGFSALGMAALALGVALLWHWEGAAPADKQPGDVRLMQWNVHWGGHPMREENWDLLRTDIEARDPDILVLNEAPFQKKRWVEALSEAKNWHMARTHGEDDNEWEYQLTVSSRWPLQLEADQPVYNGHVLLVRIDRPDRPIRLLVVDAESNVLRQSRQPMMDEVCRLLTAARAGGQTIDVVAGDFNTPGRSIAFDTMPTTAGGYLLAGRCGSGWRGTWPARYPLYDIDHVWVHHTWMVIGCERFSNSKTDHRAQLVTIRRGTSEP